MQVTQIPKRICLEVEKWQRRFIWGHSAHPHGYYPIKWSQVTLPKASGGLGFKRISSLNRACGAKLAWKILVGEKGLWAEVLNSKYVRKNEENLLTATKGDSELWHFICNQQDIISRGTRWLLRDGNYINFFTDFWLYLNKCIKDCCLRQLTTEEEGSVVSDWTKHGSWDFGRLGAVVSNEVIQRLLGQLPPIETAGGDIMRWNATQDGTFSIKSAYYLLEECPRSAYNPVYKLIWKWNGCERIRVFLWKMFNDKLPTNLWRSTWSSSSPLCSNCLREEESVLHILRDCQYARKCWLSLIKPCYNTSFFNSSLQDWTYLNLRNEVGKIEHINWPQLWGVAVWKLWSWRNASLFDSNFEKPINPAAVILSSWKSFTVHPMKESSPGTNSQQKLGWRPPPHGWIKLNVDGAVNPSTGAAGCGGVFRDSGGQWIVGFSHRIGICSVDEAEQWALYTGLHMAWERGFRRIKVESAAKLLIDQLAKPGVESNSNLLQLSIRGLMQLDWDISLSYIGRDNNAVADVLAKRGISLSVTLEECPSTLRALVHKEYLGSNPL